MYKGLRITGATLLSTRIAEKLSLDLRKHANWYWLRSPGDFSRSVASVDYEGYVFNYGLPAYSSHISVRPALYIKNIESSIFKVGDTLMFGGKEFEIISDSLALCSSDIGKCAFRKDRNAEDANDYEKSDVKKYVDDWFNKAIAPYEENPTSTPLSTKEHVKNMGSNYESITFAKNNYDNEEQMWDDIRDTLRILSKQDYQFKFYCDEQGVGVYVLQFNYKDVNMSGISLDWVGEDTE